MPRKTRDVDNSDSNDTPLSESTIHFSSKSGNLGNLIENNKIPIVIALLGLIFTGLGVFFYKNTNLFEADKIEIITVPTKAIEQSSDIVVEISGSIVTPGVYTLKADSRINDLMIVSGGLSADADRDWVEININRAAKLIDGQKLYIKSKNEQTSSLTAKNDGGYQTVSQVIGVESSGLVNINMATLADLDKLPGIGPVYGQNIIEQRPYSNIQELISRKVIPKSTYEKIQDKISVY